MATANPTSPKTPTDPFPKNNAPQGPSSFEIEVSNEVRQEQLVKAAKKYGPIVGIAIAVALGGAAFYGLQQQKINKASEAASVQYSPYLDAVADAQQNNTELPELPALPENAAGYQLLATLLEAGTLASTDAAAAVATYQKVIDNTKAPEMYRQQATILAGYAALDANILDEIEPGITTLERSNTPWQFMAREILALAAMDAGETATAEEYLRALAEDVQTPANIKQRAQQLLPLVQTTK